MRTYTELRARTAADIRNDMNSAIYDNLGMDGAEWADFDSHHISYAANWALCTFAAQDFSYAIPPDKVEASPLLVGPAYPEAQTHHYEHGILGKRVKELYTRASGGDKLAAQHFSQLSSRVAEFIYMIDASKPDWNKYLRQASSTPQTIISKNQGTLTADFLINLSHSVPYTLEGPLDSVASLGPGLSGHTMQLLLGGIAKDFHQVNGGVGGVFCSDWNRLHDESLRYRLEHTPADELSADISEQFAALPQSHYTSDGIEAGMTALRAKGITLDTVIMSSVHSAGAKECTSGVEHSAQLLRSGGYLLMLSIDQSVGPLAGLDITLPVARELFGEPLLNEPCGFNKYLADPRRYGELPASAVVFQKP